jgi:hypothetical protein
MLSLITLHPMSLRTCYGSVDQGRFAQTNTRAPKFGARVFGETGLSSPKWSGENEIRTCRELLEALKAYFKDNPGCS